MVKVLRGVGVAECDVLEAVVGQVNGQGMVSDSDETFCDNPVVCFDELADACAPHPH